jgi:protein O-GlcNAc transferase
MDTSSDYIKVILEAINQNKTIEVCKIINEIASNKYTELSKVLQLGTEIASTNKLDEALIIFNELSKYLSDEIKIFYNIGLIYSLKKNHSAAIKYYEQALQINPNDVETLLNIGSEYIDIGENKIALKKINLALSINNKFITGWINKIIALENLGFFDESIQVCNEAIEIYHNNIDLLSKQCNLFLRLKRYDDALQLQSRIIKLQPNHSKNYLKNGFIFAEQKKYQEALVEFDKAINLDSSDYKANLNKGIALVEIGSLDRAIEEFDNAIKKNQACYEAYFNKGIALYKLGSYKEALELTKKSILINPSFSEAWLNRGKLLLKLNFYKEAEDHFKNALSINPNFPEAKSNLIYAKINLCELMNLPELLHEATANLENKIKAIHPFTLSALIDNPATLRQCAEIFSSEELHPKNNFTFVKSKNKIKLGYFSSNFHNHAVGYLISGLFELHNREQFEVHGFSLGPINSDETQQYIINGMDHFHDISSKSDIEIVNLCHSCQIEIAIDLIGLTDINKRSFFEYRVAPILVNYLGYPGTMGSNYHDYIIADELIIPQQHQKYYTEKVLYLPDTYQINNYKKIIPNNFFSKSDAGMPDNKFIFASFASFYKITSAILDSWAKILFSTNNSILWLLQSNEYAINNFVREMSNRGISSDKIFFSDHVDRQKHLDRHRFVDVFLDTFPYGAHTTASDSLWVGVPLITRIGDSFASRVAASILTAAGVPELITRSQEEYEALAIDLALNTDKLKLLKNKIIYNKNLYPLFNTQQQVKNLENLFLKIKM